MVEADFTLVHPYSLCISSALDALVTEIFTAHEMDLPRAREYLHVMSDSMTLEVRREHFTRFVRRAVNRAKESRQWSIERIAKEAGVGAATIYRWLEGDWVKSPQGDAVQAFCNALGIPPGIAFGILWPGEDDRPATPEPLPTSPAVEVIMRKLNDPNVPESEKYHIRQTLESLAARPKSPRT